LNKYYDHIIKEMNKGIITNEKTYKEAQRCLNILNSNLEGKEGELMKVYNCNTSWPICLYDFTYKNKSNSYQVMKCRQSLSKYIVPNYLEMDPKNRKMRDRIIRNRRLDEDQSDVIRE